MPSQLNVDSIQPNTPGSKVLMPPGGIIQVQFTQLTDPKTISSSSSTETDVDDLAVNITPLSASSNILIQAHVAFAHSSMDDHGLIWSFKRDSTVLKADGPGSRRGAISPGSTAYYGDDHVSTASTAMYQYFDAPGTTSEITYKVVVHVALTGSLYINRTEADNDTNGYERFISSIMVTEIAG